MDSAVTSGAAASKKWRYPVSPKYSPIALLSASEVSGPVAIITGPSGISVTSSSITVIFGWERIFSVTIFAKPPRSTARQPPASTRVASAQDRIRLSKRRSSSLRSPTAFSSRSPRRELEHTSSAKSGLWWAGVIFLGFISYRSTSISRFASCQAASHPARPAPMTFTCIFRPPFWWFFSW